MTRWHYLSIAILLGILGGLVWYAPTPILTDLTQEPEARLTQYPSAYLVNTKTTQYNTAGQVSHILTTSRMRYFDGIYNIADGTILMDNPLMTLYSQETPRQFPWVASSLNGRGSQNLDELLLTGNVIFQQITNDGTFTTVTSEALLIKPEQQYAETDKPVMIKNESGVTTADGLKISLEDGIIEFPANVRSQYHAH